MDHFKIEVSEVNEPACLPAIERLGLTEIGEILVICEDLHWKRRAMEIMVPRLQSVDDSKELSVIDVVVSLCGGE